MIEDLVKALLNQALEERSDLFLLDFNITPDNAIKVVIDGDKGVIVEDCIFVSRAIEHNIDRDEHDFALEVLSAGATAPLVSPRQYPKHVGRSLGVKTTEGSTLEGELKEVNANALTLRWKAREPKPVGKGKRTVIKEQNIAFEDISEAKVKIKF